MIKIFEKISVSIGYIIFGCAILLYVANITRQPFEKVSSVGLAAFALVAAVSGLCFAMAQVLDKENEKSKALYSGEKLLHSSVLILETLVLKYASDAVLSATVLKSHETVITVVYWVSFGLIFIISSYAAYFLLYGFEALHDFLWNRFQLRRQNMNNKKHKTN